MSRELCATMARALDGVHPRDDPLDELRARLDCKRLLMSP